MRPRLDFSDPRRFEQMRDVARSGIGPTLADRLLGVLAFAMMVAGGVFVALVLLGAIGG